MIIHRPYSIIHLRKPPPCWKGNQRRSSAGPLACQDKHLSRSALPQNELYSSYMQTITHMPYELISKCHNHVLYFIICHNHACSPCITPQWCQLIVLSASTYVSFLQDAQILHGKTSRLIRFSLYGHG